MRLALIALLFVGCGVPGGKDGGVDGGTPSWPEGALSVGTISTTSGDGFAPFGTEVGLTPGAQGGYHVETRYKIVGQSATDVLFTHIVRLTDGGTLVSRGTRRFDIDTDPWVSENFPVFMCPTPVGVNVANEFVTFEITATAPDGGLLGRTGGTTKLRCDPGAYCETICRG